MLSPVSVVLLYATMWIRYDQVSASRSRALTVSLMMSCILSTTLSMRSRVSQSCYLAFPQRGWSGDLKTVKKENGVIVATYKVSLNVPLSADRHRRLFRAMRLRSRTVRSSPLLALPIARFPKSSVAHQIYEVHDQCKYYLTCC